MSELPFSSYGQRPIKGGTRKKRKDVASYAGEYSQDFISRSVIHGGEPVLTLVCRFCLIPIAARSDRIKEHLASKRHQKLKGVQQTNGAPDLMSEDSSNDIPLERCAAPVPGLFNAMPGAQKSSWLPMQNNNTPGESQRLVCLRWTNNMDNHILTTFANYRAQGLFVDLTLFCEGKSIKCHKLILSACSTYFEKTLLDNPNQHPVIFLHNLGYWEVHTLVEFMYSGEITVPHNKLQPLIVAGESLKVKGLYQTRPGGGGVAKFEHRVSPACSTGNMQQNMNVNVSNQNGGVDACANHVLSAQQLFNVNSSLSNAILMRMYQGVPLIGMPLETLHSAPQMTIPGNGNSPINSGLNGNNGMSERSRPRQKAETPPTQEPESEDTISVGSIKDEQDHHQGPKGN